MLNAVYINQTLALARSFLIKSDLVALETEYTVTNTPDYTKPEEWKYYLNLSGQYHGTDTPMTIDSLDNLETIAFTADVINDHPITKTKLLQFEEDFTKLVNRYPDQILLIYGILYQPSIDTVIKSDELTILGWNTGLVNLQELDLIQSVQERIRRGFNQIASKDWNAIEVGYSAAYLAKLAMSMVYYIRAERASRKFTGQAHDYFVWNYINSYVYLEDLKSLFSVKDVMYLYKNIDRMKRASGSNDIQDEIFEKFITPRGIKGYNLNVRREPGTLQNTAKQKIDYYDVGINNIESRPMVATPILARHHKRSVDKLPEYEENIDRKMKYSVDTSGTREITLLDDATNSPSVRYTMSAVDLSFQLIPYNTLAYTIVNHIDNITYNLTYAEICILYMRLVQMRTGSKTENIPTFVSGSVPKMSIPTAQYLADNYELPLVVGEALVRNFPGIPTETNNLVLQAEYKVKFEKWKRWMVNYLRGFTNQNNMSFIDRIYGEFHQYIEVKLVEGEVNFETWLQARGIILGDMDERDIYLIEEIILTEVFRIELGDTTDSSTTQLAKMLDRFTSYHINVEIEYNANMNLPSNLPMVMIKRASLKAPKSLRADLPTVNTSLVCPQPKSFANAGLFASKGKIAAKQKHTSPAPANSAPKPLRIIKPMTGPIKLEI